MLMTILLTNSIYISKMYISPNLLQDIPQGGCWVNLPEDILFEYLGKSFYTEGGKRGILHRLSMNKPSLTLLCTPSQKQTERCHPLKTDR